MARPRSKPQMSLTSAHVWDDAAGIPENDWCRRFFEHIYLKLDDADFAHLYEEGGRYPISRVLLMCTTVLQYMSGESDRAAVRNTVRWRHWRIALGRDRYWEGFDPSVLCNFRKRLLRHQEGMLIFDHVLQRIRALGLLEGLDLTDDERHLVEDIRQRVASTPEAWSPFLHVPYFLVVAEKR